MANHVNPNQRHPQVRRVSRGTGLLLPLIMATLCGVFFLPIAVLVMGGMLPSLVAYVIDDERKKSISTTVALMNAAGVIPFIIELWKKGHGLHESFAIMERPMTWLYMYGAAAMGWLIIYSVPAVVQALLTHRANVRIIDIEKRQASLITQWGEAVRGHARKPQQKAGGN